MEALLSLRDVRKRFGTVQAVDGVDLDLHAGEIHALVGENGAGKSTLSAIAFGAVIPDSGAVETRARVGLVHQHFQLVDRLTVWENVLLGREPRRGWQIDREAARRRVRELSAQHGLAIEPDARVESLPVGMQQRVELLRELERSPRIILLDEPTAALAPSEIAAFFATITALANDGAAILVVTHKLNEVIAYSQRVTVMRAGRVVDRVMTHEATTDSIARAMVGGELPELAPRAEVVPKPGLRVHDLTAGGGSGALHGVTLEVAAGEIVGIAGIEGNGQSALADALAGVLPYTGTIAVRGTTVATQTPAAHLAASIRTIPQDRRAEALVADWTIAENVLIGRQRNATMRRGALIDDRARAESARAIITAFDVRPPNPHAVVDGLSGGNQQKVVVGRALADAPAVVIAYQPTRGIDVGAAALVQSRLIEARNAGASVLLISFELDEVFTLADRVLVLSGGRIAGEFARDALDRERIGALMAGAQ